MSNREASATIAPHHPAAGHSPPEARYPRPAYAWYVCAILLLAYILSFLDRTIVSLLVVPIEHDLHIGDTEVSLLQGFSFAIFYALLGLPIARLIDARRRRTVIAAGILIWSVMTAGCGLANRFWHLFLTRVGVGAGEATLLPGANSLLADYFPPHRRGLALGIFATGIFLGAGSALIIGGLVIRALGTAPLHVPLIGQVHPWQAVFFVVGLPGLVVAALMMTVREPPRLDALGRRQAMSGGVPLAEVAAYMNANRRTLCCHTFGFTFLAFTAYAASAWIPTMFVREYGWTAAEIGVRFGLLALVMGPLGSIVGGFLCDRYERRGRRDGKFRVGIIAALGTILPGIAFPLMHTPGQALLVIVPFFFFVSFVWGIAPAALQELLPNRMRGQGTAVYTGVLNLIALGGGPTSVALLADYGLGGPGHLGLAIAIVSPISALIAAVLFRIGLAPYRATLQKLVAQEGR